MKRLLFVLLLIVASSLSVLAQRTISGKVTDANNEPLIGATIVAEGTSAGTATDVDGGFTLNIPDGVTSLLVSYTGFSAKRVPLSTSNVYNITLESDVTVLQDVVVIGYGTASRKELTGSVSKVSGETIGRLPVTGVDQALQGQAAGVQVTTASGTPGSSVAIRVRGPSSITGSNEPLYVVDGIPINTGSYSQLGFGNQVTNALADLNPADIESIEILKDAASASIYGSRAANGVVLITTKRGRQQKTQISLNTYYGGQEVWRRIEPTTGPEYVALIQEMVRNRFGATAVPSGPSTRLIGLDNDPASYPSTNWQDEIFRTGAQSQTDLAISGGNERTKFYLSGSYFLQDGTIKGSSFNRYNFRFNLDNIVSDKFKVGMTNFFSRSLSTRINNDNNIFGVLSAALLMGSHIPTFNPDGTYGRDPNASIESPIAAYREPTNDAFNNRLNSSFFGEYTLLPGLNFRVQVGVDYLGFREFRFNPTTTNAGAGTGGTGIEALNEELNLVNENYFTYRNTFGKFGFDALLGASFQNSNRKSFFAQGENFPGNTIRTLNASSIKRDITSTETEWGLNSYFSRLNFNWDRKYFLSFSGRYDGSSRFGANNRWSFFPSVSGAWRISEEGFLRDNTFISDLKLKASWGVRGNQEIGNFSSRALISPGANYLQRAGLAPTQLGNPDLTWEEREDIDLGLEIGLLRDRLILSVEAYQGKTRELLLNRPLVGSSGFTSITENIGAMLNRGIDIGLTTTNISNNKIQWTTNLNVSFFENEITALAGTPFASGFASWVAEGEAIGSFRGFRVERIFQTQAEIDALNATARERTGNPNAVYQSTLTRPGDIMFRDLNGDGLITTADQEILGNANPRFYGGVTNNISAFGFDLSFFFQFTVGNMIYNNTRAFSEGMNGVFGQAGTVRNRWTPENPTTDTRYPRAVFGDPNNNRRTSDRFLEDGSFVRLKNLTLGYTIPKNVINKAGLTNARIYVSGQNLLTFTNYSGFDPEVNTFTAGQVGNLAQGTDFLTFPQPRVLLVGLNLGF